ncbi:Thioredoxin reductase [Filimonas lacunae]|uniref:Thioredoxin reductase n=1 Tax=Filimonas lacunae TaxID=477680 RepID=A0A173MQ11_9BACT|nr:NAD(P)/FAD-dependent oxidoreductase [Filimonas lacunae]BAV09418.1 thioredoxin reductase [Filimonas lacunae]SIS72792.1 Thioredoxin reductase [Filimonas lacunae]
MVAKETYDVIIIGGSFAGLQAGMTLGRSLRKTLIIDSALPCNRQTPHSHNFLTHDGAVPAKLAALAREQTLQYPTVQLLQGKAITGGAIENGFSVTTEAGETFHSRKLLFASGIKDNLPAIPGIAESWGISVIHCPYCHGYEVRQQPTGIIANGELAFHFAQLINNLTNQLTLFTNGQPELTAEQLQQLQQKNITIETRNIKGVLHQQGYLHTIVLEDETQVAVKALYLKPNFEQHCSIPAQLGCEISTNNLLVVDGFYKTTIPGVYAAGDCTSMMRSVSVAVASGMSAGAFINKELVSEAFQ